MNQESNDSLTQEEINHKRALMNQGIDNIPTQNLILNSLTQERQRQDNKFGSSPRNLHSSVWILVLLEELGEVARAILENDSIGYPKELTQVGACAIAALEDYYLGKQALSIEDVGCGIKYELELF